MGIFDGISKNNADKSGVHVVLARGVYRSHPRLTTWKYARRTGARLPVVPLMLIMAGLLVSGEEGSFPIARYREEQIQIINLDSQAFAALLSQSARPGLGLFLEIDHSEPLLHGLDEYETLAQAAWELIRDYGSGDLDEPHAYSNLDQDGSAAAFIEVVGEGAVNVFPFPKGWERMVDQVRAGGPVEPTTLLRAQLEVLIDRFGSKAVAEMAAKLTSPSP